MTIGITSPSRGEGKTLVASNLAVSLALGLQRKTVLVDFNFITPRLHRIFDVADKPGLAEAFSNGQIYVSQTAIEHLSVLSAGSVPEFQARVLQTPGSIAERLTQNQKFHLGLDKLAAFRDVVYSLEQEFEFVIVDMPSLKTGDISVQFANQLNGLVLVVDTTKTKRKDIDDMFRQISQRQVIGFVLNRFNE
jgi:Mrp family chromosome partitioning ATPase